MLKIHHLKVHYPLQDLIQPGNSDYGYVGGGQNIPYVSTVDRIDYAGVIPQQHHQEDH